TADELVAQRVVPDEGHAPVRPHPARRWLADVVEQRGEAQRLPVVELVRERFGERALEARPELRPEDGGRVALDLEQPAQDLDRVTVDVEVVEVALLYAVEGVELGEHGGDEAEAVGQLEPGEHP